MVTPGNVSEKTYSQKNVKFTVFKDFNTPGKKAKTTKNVPWSKLPSVTGIPNIHKDFFEPDEVFESGEEMTFDDYDVIISVP